ncbi:MAG: hypothetical protein WCW87_01105 [Candidatus Paceibacterota bacterium]
MKKKDLLEIQRFSREIHNLKGYLIFYLINLRMGPQKGHIELGLRKKAYVSEMKKAIGDIKSDLEKLKLQQLSILNVL